MAAAAVVAVVSWYRVAAVGGRGVEATLQDNHSRLQTLLRTLTLTVATFLHAIIATIKVPTAKELPFTTGRRDVVKKNVSSEANIMTAIMSITPRLS